MLDDFQSLEERVSMLASRRPCPWLSAVWTVEEEGGRDGGRARWITSFSLIVLSRGTPKEGDRVEGRREKGIHSVGGDGREGERERGPTRS